MGMNFRKAYEMDETTSEEGVWIPLENGGEIKVARGSNSEAKRIREKLQAPWQARPGFRQRKKMSEEDEKRITIEILARACLKDWKQVDLSGLENLLEEQYGINLENTEDATYTPELGIALMTEFEEFFAEVVLISTNEDLYRADAVEDDVSS